MRSAYSAQENWPSRHRQWRRKFVAQPSRTRRRRPAEQQIAVETNVANAFVRRPPNRIPRLMGSLLLRLEILTRTIYLCSSVGQFSSKLIELDSTVPALPLSAAGRPRSRRTTAPRCPPDSAGTVAAATSPAATARSDFQRLKAIEFHKDRVSCRRSDPFVRAIIACAARWRNATILDVLSASRKSLESIWPAISCQLLIRRITEHLRKT